MTTYLKTNLTLAERLEYDPDNVTREELIEALLDHESWVDLRDRRGSADEIEGYIDTLEEKEEKPSDYDDLKSFFDDCVESLNAHWPCAEVYDMNLRTVICEAITRGDVEEETE